MGTIRKEMSQKLMSMRFTGYIFQKMLEMSEQ